MLFSDLINPNLVLLPISSTDKFSAIEEFITLSNDYGFLKDYKSAISLLIARERIRHTGSFDFGFPRACSDLVVSQFIIVGISHSGIIWDINSNNKVKLVVLYMSPLPQMKYLQGIAEISKRLHISSNRECLMLSTTKDDLFSRMSYVFRDRLF